MSKVCNKCRIQKDLTEFYNGKSVCKDCYKARQKRHYNDNKEMYFKRANNRNANGGNFTKKQKEAIFNKYGHRCQICRCTENLTADHKLPQIICNPNTASIEANAWILCRSCNNAKSKKLLKEVIADVPSGALKGLILDEYAETLRQGRYELRPITIGGKLFTEVKFNKFDSLCSA